MAQKILTTFVDDIDGTDAEGTIKFGLDGIGYEIDLNTQHAKELRETLARYVEHGRRTVGTRRAAAAPATAARRQNGSTAQSGPKNLAAARDWLRSNPDALNGRELKDRGRLPGDLVALVPDYILYGGTPPASVPASAPAPATTTPAPATTTEANDGEPASIEDGDDARQLQLVPPVTETPATTRRANKAPKTTATTATTAEPATTDKKPAAARRRTAKS